MKVTVVSHTYVTAMNQSKVQALTKYFSAVHLIAPTVVKDTLREIRFNLMDGAQFSSSVVPSYFDFHNSTRIYHPQQLQQALTENPSDLWLVEQEPYSLSTLQILLLKKKLKAKVMLYSFQNIFKNYPIPFRWVEKKCLQLSDGLVVGSESARDVWIQKGYSKDKIHILPQVGVDLDFFEPRNAQEARKNLSIPDLWTFGFAGRLVEEKGVQVLLQAMSVLKKYNFQILIVGRGPYEESLRKICEKNGLSSRVHFIGAPTHEQMPKFLQAMDVLVLPSLTRPHWREQFGHVLIEAMSCERPCLGSDYDPINKIIKECGFIFTEGDSYSLAEKMLILMNNRIATQELGLKAREIVRQNYTNECIAKNLFNISKDLISGTLL